MTAFARAQWPRLNVILIRSTSASFGASIACAPILARIAPSLPAGGLIANLLAVPVGETVALPLCLFHALLSPIPNAELANSDGSLTALGSTYVGLPESCRP